MELLAEIGEDTHFNGFDDIKKEIQNYLKSPILKLLYILMIKIDTII